MILRNSEQMRAGLFMGLPSILLNLFQGLGSFLLGIMLSLPNITIGAQTFTFGYIVWGPICACILIGVLIYTKYYIHLDYKGLSTHEIQSSEIAVNY